MYGELIPQGGGDPIPLLKKNLLVGRRESCDIRLRFPNVSAHHCQLTVNGGYWYVRDLNSRNGIKVNHAKVTEKRIDPGDTLSIAKHDYEVNYVPTELGAVGPPPPEDSADSILGKSLLERAGLSKALSEAHDSGGSHDGSRDGVPYRYDVLNDGAGQIRDPNKPV